MSTRQFIFKKIGWYKYNIILTLSLLVFCVQPLIVAQDVGNEVTEQTEEEKAFIKAIEKRFGKKMDQITKEEWYKETQRVWEERMHVMAGRYILQGEVVDEQGVRLNGVEVRIDKPAKHGEVGVFDSLGELFKENGNREAQEEVWTINGTFNLDIKGYINLRLWFSKNGYYSEKLDFGFKEEDITPETDRAIREGKKVEPLVLKKEDIRVVLEKQGALTSLIRYTGPLEYTTGGKGIIIDFDIIPGNYDGISEVRRVENIEDPKQLPENCVYMVADKDLDGKIVTVRKTWTSEYPILNYKEDREYVVPQRIKLIMTAPESGFIEYKPGQNKKMPRQMKEAPETGYQNELVIESGRFERGSREADIHFYFKSRDKYGKGEIGTFGLYDDNSKVRIGVSFNLQPDGSRNLETVE